MPPSKARVAILCLILGLSLPTQPFQRNQTVTGEAKVPAAIRQGPILNTNASPGDPYWYQTGAIGDSASNYYVAASVMIRTVYDRVNNDAHSYWVGGFIANGAFVQVGVLNEITTTGQSYCCAWFFEYFYSSSSLASGCCAPRIGAEGSAGPIGSWHNYTINSNGDGTWSFFMDSSLLGTSLDLGGPGATNSGNNPPGAIAEVAAASSNTDIIGPGEFKSLNFRIAGGNWEPVPQAKSLIWYGKGSFDNGSPPPNPYGAREVEGIDNDFLAGSFITPLNTPASPASATPSLWPTAYLPCCISFSFVDPDGESLAPSWVSLQSINGVPVYYTQYENQFIEDGTWNLKSVVWHSANVSLPANQFTTPGTTNQTFHPNVFSIKVRVVGLISNLPVGAATLTTNFPDGVKQEVVTDSNGNASLTQLPANPYILRLSVPFGIPAILSENVTGSLQVTARVFALAEVLLIAGIPIGTAIAVSVLVVMRERKQRAAMPTLPPSMVIVGNCLACGQPLHPGEMNCSHCGAAVKPSYS